MFKKRKRSKIRSNGNRRNEDKRPRTSKAPIRIFEDYYPYNVFLNDTTKTKPNIIEINKIGTTDKHTFYPSSFIFSGSNSDRYNYLVLHKFKCVKPYDLCNLIYELHPLVKTILLKTYKRQKIIENIIKKFRGISPGQSLIIEITPQSMKSILQLKQSYENLENYIVRYEKKIIINGDNTNCIRFENSSANNDFSNNNNTDTKAISGITTINEPIEQQYADNPILLKDADNLKDADDPTLLDTVVMNESNNEFGNFNLSMLTPPNKYIN